MKMRTHKRRNFVRLNFTKY